MNWITELKSGDKSVLWKNFHPVSVEELQAVEQSIGRILPEDFREFYQEIGYGRWPSAIGGGIYLPDEILQTIGAPIYFVLGSLFPGDEWATKEQHVQLWLSKGVSNPAPMKFTASVLAYHGLNLTDLLQIGTDGGAGYQMIHLANSSSIGYMVIPESGEPEFVCGSFKEGILRITDWLIADDDA